MKNAAVLKQIHVRIPRDLYKSLRVEAAKLDLNLNELVEKALASGLKILKSEAK